MTTTLCTSGIVKLHAGANVSAALTDAQYTSLINEAEAFISESSQYDFVANYSSLPTNLKPLLELGTACHAAFNAIKYDQSGYTSRQEAQVMLDANWTQVVEINNLLRDAKYKNFVLTGTTG